MNLLHSTIPATPDTKLSSRSPAIGELLLGGANEMLRAEPTKRRRLATGFTPHVVFRKDAPHHLPRHLVMRVLAYRLQADRLGDLDVESQRLLESPWR